MILLQFHSDFRTVWQWFWTSNPETFHLQVNVVMPLLLKVKQETFLEMEDFLLQLLYGKNALFTANTMLWWLAQVQKIMGSIGF